MGSLLYERGDILSYTALNFMYDGLPSERFGVFLCNISDTGLKTDDGGGNVTVHTTKTPLMDSSYLLGVEYEENFEFEFTFGSYKPKDKYDISVLNNWLIGKHKFCKLQILQLDMSSCYYNCIMTDFKIVSFGNLPFAFKCNVICDRGWALEKTSMFNYRLQRGENIIMHKNISHTNTLTYPIVEFTSNKSEGVVSIINLTNNNYETKISNLLKGEKITLDNKLQLINSSLGLLRLGNFNKHWFELVPSVNKLKIVGDIDNIKISYEGIRKIG